MNALLWFFATILLLFVFSILAVRLARPHSRKMAKEQTHLDKKTGTGSGAYTATASGTSATTPPGRTGEERWYAKYLWSIVLVIVGVGLVYWGFNTQIRPADAGSWSWNHWLPLLILWGIVSALIALNAKSLGAAAKVLQGVLMGVMFLLFIGFPALVWIKGDEKPSPQHATRSEVPLASSPQSTWPKLVIPASGESEQVVVPPSMRTRMIGDQFRLRIVYQDGTECILPSPNCPAKPQRAVYAVNDSKEKNIVSYAFLP